MRTVSLSELSTRSETELDVLFRLCSEQICHAERFDPQWLGATTTAANIIRLRARRKARPLTVSR